MAPRRSRLVVDASVAVQLSLAADGFSLLDDVAADAPALLRSEALSALHELRWRGVVSAELAQTARDRLAVAPVELFDDLSGEAWAVADALGWAKTYDAEYVALARRRDIPLLTVDARLRRGAGRLVSVIGPTEL